MELYQLLNEMRGLVYGGTVDAVPGANQFTISSLAGLGAGKFAGATNPYQAFVLRDAGGASAAPQGEYQAITAYTTTTGNFTTAAFTAAVAVGDDVLIIHPAMINILVILADLAVPAADAVTNALMRDLTGNKADTAVQALSATSSQMRYIKGIMDALLTAVGITAWPASAPPANGVSFAEAIRQIYDDLIAVQATLAGMPVSSPLFNTTQTTQGATITLFQLDALAGNIDDIEVVFYLAADAAATFTPTWELTRPGDLVTFTTQLIPAIATIVTPGAAGVYRYPVGNIPQGLSGRFRLAQNGLGAANVLCDASCTFKS